MLFSLVYNTIEVTLPPSSTIEALIRFHNGYATNEDILSSLIGVFNELNPNAKPPKPYQKVLIPVLIVTTPEQHQK